MRCPDCSKFVGLDNGDPEVDSIDATWNQNAVGPADDTWNVNGAAPEVSSETPAAEKPVEASTDADKETKPGKYCGSITVNASVSAIRNCADCGQELKRASFDMEKEIELSAMEGWKNLSNDERDELTKMLDDGEVDPEVNEDGGESEDGGGGRYAKNMITTTIHFTLDVKATLKSGKKVELSISDELSDDMAAGEYEESV